jgi:hypothetical protein
MSNVIFKAYDLPAYSLDAADHILSRQENGEMGYIKSVQFATTGSNIFTGGQIIVGNLTIDGNIYANQFNVTTTSIEHFTASTNFGIDSGDTHTFTGSVRITGSLNTLGNSTITGSFLVSGSTTQIGDNTLLGNTQLYGNIDVSGSTNFHNHTITMTGSMFTSGSQVITGSLDINGNVNVASGSEFYLHGNKLFNYGQFSDTTTQSGSANTAYSMKFNTTDTAHEVSIVDGTKIKVDNTGLYNLQFSAQLDNSANTNELVDIWFAITGSNVANSNTQLAINKAQAGNFGKSVAAWNILLPLSASNYVEIKWSATNSTITLSSIGTQTNPNRPAVPSVIATMTQVA